MHRAGVERTTRLSQKKSLIDCATMLRRMRLARRMPSVPPPPDLTHHGGTISSPPQPPDLTYHDSDESDEDDDNDDAPPQHPDLTYYSAESDGETMPPGAGLLLTPQDRAAAREASRRHGAKSFGFILRAMVGEKMWGTAAASTPPPSPRDHHPRPRGGKTGGKRAVPTQDSSDDDTSSSTVLDATWSRSRRRRRPSRVARVRKIRRQGEALTRPHRRVSKKKKTKT